MDGFYREMSLKGLGAEFELKGKTLILLFNLASTLGNEISIEV
ncbi:hypothetical protein SAMN02745221_02103 [Thermosyntropha lipolytica DSM 11003]|uniref:Uncharacterized protein n=1 Tax=Thermosyntropha lipolytica DSM 11003 TaxID=1123382 RepID=A0A1M5RTE3_9FIRM|nr:hypothetical protein SAMN02745221_02103 [Thermosyntropha lipolytica DSM 11003]